MPGATVLLLQQLSSKQKQLQPQSLALICTLRRCSKRLRTWPHLCWKAWPKVQNCRWAPVPRANQWLVAWPQRCFSGRSWWSNNQKKLWKNGCFLAKEMRSNEDVIDKIMYPRCSRFIIEKAASGGILQTGDIAHGLDELLFGFGLCHLLQLTDRVSSNIWMDGVRSVAIIWNCLKIADPLIKCLFFSRRMCFYVFFRLEYFLVDSSRLEVTMSVWS